MSSNLPPNIPALKFTPKNYKSAGRQPKPCLYSNNCVPPMTHYIQSADCPSESVDRSYLAVSMMSDSGPEKQSQQNNNENMKANWRVGSLCSIFSRSKEAWFDGVITEIQGEGDDEWLHVIYKNKSKQIQRNCVDIKSIPLNHPSYFKKGSICMIKSDDKSANNKQWCFGKVIDIFNDNEGEWLSIKYTENNIIKICDIQRHSRDIKLIVESKNDNENNNNTNTCLTCDMDSIDMVQQDVVTPLPPTFMMTPLNDCNFDNIKLEQQTNTIISPSIHVYDKLTTPKPLINSTFPVKMVISRLKQNKPANSPTPIDESVPTPVSDQAMFKFFSKIDMGKIRVSSLSIGFSSDDYNYASDDSSHKFINSNSNENKLSPPLAKMLSNSNENKLSLPFANSIMLSQSMESESESENKSIDSDSNGYVDSDTDSDSDMLGMLGMMQAIDEDIIYAKHGYKKIKKLENILQGELLLVEEIKTQEKFAIKKTEIKLFKQNIAIDDDGDYIFTSENRRKECEILKYLTNFSKNDPMNQYIVKYYNSFESDEHYYIVIEYIESETNLKQFINKCRKYIYENKLTLEEYQSKIKKVFWQLIITIYWLHNEKNCTHLDLFMENIMLTNCNFILKNNKVIINNNVSIKLIDFGVSEVFKNKVYLCNKTDLSINNESYLAASIDLGDTYNACGADMFTLGMILFECLTLRPLYEPEIAQINSRRLRNQSSLINIATKKRKSLLPTCSLSLSSSENGSNIFLNNGYIALQKGSLKEYLSANELIQYFDSDSFALLNNLLKVNESQRYSSYDVIYHKKSKWFSNESYYTTYINNQNVKAKQDKTTILKNFPFYVMGHQF